MTEAEWLACDDASAMVEAMAGRVSDRKIRLFGVACCRHLELMACPEFFQAMKASESHADVKPNKAALRRDQRAVRRARFFTLDDREGAEEWATLRMAEVAASEDAHPMVAREIDLLVLRGQIYEYDRPPGPDLARCIFGNPYRVPGIAVEAFSPIVLELARTIYDDRAFDRLPILADALEESGCDDAALLAHCREDLVHARGCWVVDLIMGRS